MKSSLHGEIFVAYFLRGIQTTLRKQKAGHSMDEQLFYTLLSPYRCTWPPDLLHTVQKGQSANLWTGTSMAVIFVVPQYLPSITFV